MMDNQDISEELDKISDPLLKQRYLRFYQLAPNLRYALFAEETSKTIRLTAQENNLNDDQMHQLALVVGTILLGEVHIADFVKSVKTKCATDEKTAYWIARNINQKIFIPCKEELKLLHKIAKWPGEQTASQPTAPPSSSSVSPAPSSPQIPPLPKIPPAQEPSIKSLEQMINSDRLKEPAPDFSPQPTKPEPITLSTPPLQVPSQPPTESSPLQVPSRPPTEPSWSNLQGNVVDLKNRQQDF